MEFTTTIEVITPNTVIIKISGILDKETAPSVRRETIQQLEENRTNIIFDLSLITQIDSAGLGMIVGTLARCRNREGNCIVLTPSEEVRRAIRVTKLDQLLKIENTPKKAIRAINEPSGA